MPYLSDDDESSSDNSILDAEEFKNARDFFANLHAQPGYVCTDTPMDDY